MLETIIAGILTGLVLLIFEFWTGWFAERTRLPNIRPIICRSIDSTLRFFKKNRKVLNDIGFISILISVAYVFLLLLTPEARLDANLRGTLIILLIVLAITTFKNIKSPIGDITGFIIIANIMAACMTLGSPSFLSIRWRLWSITSALDFDNVKTLSMGITILMSILIWAIGCILWSHIAVIERNIDERLSLLYDASGIVQILQSEEQERYNSLLFHWASLLSHLEAQNSRNADLMRHCLPILFKGYSLQLGCKTNTDVHNITKPIYVGRRSFPAPLVEIEGSVREFLNCRFLKIQVVKIDESQYEQKYVEISQINQKNKI